MNSDLNNWSDIIGQLDILKTIFNSLITQVFIHKYQFNNHLVAKNNQRMFWKT